MEYDLAIITGASSGIGAAIAKKLCATNIEVLAVSRSAQKLNKTKLTLPKKAQLHYSPLAADIRKPQDRNKIIERIPKSGRILLVNNAGVGYFSEFHKLTSQKINEIINTNLVGTISLTHLLLKKAHKYQQVDIAFVTSLAGKIGFPGLSVYSATKFAIEGFTDALRSEYKDKSIRIMTLRPGVTNTNFFVNAKMSKFYQSVKGTRALHSPDKVAEVFCKQLHTGKAVVVVGSDKFYLKLLPLTPRRWRFNLLDLTNKL